jgi:putative phosphoribosyl transferase
VAGLGRWRASFVDRRDAGVKLAAAVAQVLSASPRPSGTGGGTVVLGLPRGGVVLAAEVADALGAAWDVVLVRKLGAPHRPELGLGAIAEDGVRVLNERLIARLGVTDEELDAVTSRERAELDRRAALYRHDGPRATLTGATVVVVDDGLATGYTALAALESVRRRGAARTLLAVPVGARDAVALLRPAVDDLVCLVVPAEFEAVGQAYRTFGQVPDAEVLAALDRDPRRRDRSRPAGPTNGRPR